MRYTMRSGRTDWRSWKLKKRVLIPLALLELALIATILVLERLSAANNGFVTVRDVPAMPATHFSITNLSWSYGLLWTALPAFLFGLYRIAWEAAVAAAADRQPYVELVARGKDEASSLRKTAMLDYRNYPAWNAWWIARKRGHKLISAAMILSFIVSILVTPLTAHLLAAAPTFKSNNVDVINILGFDDQAITAQTDLQAALNVAAAVTAFGASAPAWSTGQYAFAPFNVTSISNKSGNVTANVTAYSGLLDCRVLSNSEFSVSQNGGYVRIDASDRGCSIPTVDLNTSTNITNYMLSWSTVACSLASHYSRFGTVVAHGQGGSDAIANLTFLSCIPSYWTTNGILTVQYGPGTVDTAPKYIDFAANESSATEIRPFFASAVENMLPAYKAFDPSNTFETDAWGRVVYQISSRKNPALPLAAENVQDGTQKLFSAFFASLASTSAFTKAASSNTTATGQLSEQRTRLYVVSPVAWTIAGVLLLVLACNICLMWISETRPSILREDPKGLVGSAALLRRSDIFNVVDRLPADQKIWSALKEHGQADETKCWFDEETQRICVSGPLMKQRSTGSA